MNGEPVLYDPETDTLLVELRPWPAMSPGEVNQQVGGEDLEDGLVVHYGPDGLPHAFEVDHASQRPDRSRAPSPPSATPRASRPERGPQNVKQGDMIRARVTDDGTVVEVLRDGSERPLVPEVDWSRIDATTEAEIAAQIAADDAEAMRDADAYARRVRRRTARAPEP